MFKTKYLYSNLWKSFVRNERWRRNLLSKILLTFVTLYFILIFSIIGFNIDKILIKLGGDPISKFNALLLWYIAIDLFMRSIWQSLPAIEIIPYLRLPIKRDRIIKHLLSRSILNLFNVIPFFIILPFTLKMILPGLGITAVLSYLSGFILMVIFNHFISVLILFLSKKNNWFFYIPLVLVLSLVSLGVAGISIQNFSILFGQQLIRGNILVYFILILLIVLTVYYISHFLSRNFYIDELRKVKDQKPLLGIFGTDIFKGLGEIGIYLAMEIKLLLRNKRPRQLLRSVPLFIAYFLFQLSTNKTFQNPIFLLLIITLLIGFGSSIYGQFMFSWESVYFDLIAARVINFENYLKAKFYLMSGSSLIIFIPVAITLLITKKAEIDLLAAILLFICGVNSFNILFFATFHDARIDLEKSSYFNYQGLGASQYMGSLLFMALPLAIYSLFNYLFNPVVGEIALGLPGLIFVVFHKWWIKVIIMPQFRRRKYKNLEGYRKLSY